MEENLLFEEINRATQDKFGFKLRHAQVDRRARVLTLEILYNDGVMLSGEVQGVVLEKLREAVPTRYEISPVFIKNFVGENYVLETVERYLSENTRAIFCETKRVEVLEEHHFLVTLTIEKISYNYAISKNLSGEISKFLCEKFEGFSFDVTLLESQKNSEEIEEIKSRYMEKEANQNSVRKIEFSGFEEFIGRCVYPPAIYIKDIIEPMEEVVICGKIENLKSYEKKSKQVEESKTKRRRERTTFRWTLAGLTGSIDCICFAGKASKAKMLSLGEGSEVAVRGEIQLSTFSGELTCIAKDISPCKLPEDFKEKFVFHLEKPFYEFISPEPVVTYAQDDLLSFGEVKPVPKILEGKTFVCYDLETTGTHYEEGDKIIEIGAVKIENGKITESFSCMVNPERPISKGATKVNGIIDDDVKNAYKDYQVLQDFYKFTRGATLIGYNNIKFDNVFLVGQGKNCRWDFEQPSDDVYNYALKLVHGVKNYKLGTVAAKLGVVLENAHRAIYDAKATAEIFIKLAEML